MPASAPLGSLGYFCYAFCSGPRFISLAQPKQGERGVRLDELRQDGAGNAQEDGERVFILAHPEERLRSRIQRLCVARVHCERDISVPEGLLEKTHVNVHTREAPMALI